MDKKLLTIDVSHGTTHDGPGMRTTVFVKGCSLRCLWCQNPESICPTNEVWWDKTLCIGCMSCAEVCPTGGFSAVKRASTLTVPFARPAVPARKPVLPLP